MPVAVAQDTKQRMYEFLQMISVGVLSTVTPDNDPHGVVVYFGIDQKLTASILTQKDTRKYDNILHNNHVMLTVFEAKSQTTVQITGTAHEVTDTQHVNTIAQANLEASMKTSEAGVPPILKLLAGDYVSFSIKPVSITMAVFARPDPGDYNELFETISSFELKDFET